MQKKAVYLAICLVLPVAYLAHTVPGESATMVAPCPSRGDDQQARSNPSLLSSKVFTLKSVDHMVVEEKIHGLLDTPDSLGGQRGVGLGGLMPGSDGVLLSVPNANTGGALGGGLGAIGMFGFAGGGNPIGGGQPNPGGVLGIGGGFGGAGGLGALGFAGSSVAGPVGRSMPASTAPSWRMVVDERTHSVIFRGKTDDLQTVAEIVALAELKADQPLPTLQRLGAFRLKHANAADLVEKLDQLEINVRLCAFDASNIIAALGTESARKEVGELIKALDVEVKEK